MVHAATAQPLSQQWAGVVHSHRLAQHHISAEVAKLLIVQKEYYSE